jgi:hypothetical protein
MNNFPMVYYLDVFTVSTNSLWGAMLILYLAIFIALAITLYIKIRTM